MVCGSIAATVAVAVADFGSWSNSPRANNARVDTFLNACLAFASAGTARITNALAKDVVINSAVAVVVLAVANFSRRPCPPDADRAAIFALERP